MTETRVLFALALALIATILIAVAHVQDSRDAHGCRATGGQWHPIQRTCTWIAR